MQAQATFPVSQKKGNFLTKPKTLHRENLDFAEKLFAGSEIAPLH